MNICNNISPILSITRNIFNIICIIVPILLIIGLSKQLIIMIKDPDNKKGFKGIINSIIATIIIFFIPTLINSLLGVIGNNTTNNTLYIYSSCWSNPTKLNSNPNYIPTNDKEAESIIPDSSDYEKGDKRNNDNSSSGSSNSNNSVEDSYGVFLGLDHSNGLDKLYKYKLVVIDLQEYSKKDVDKLHSKGIKVYSYLNVGSVEEYRSYFKKFKSLYLGTYKNWEDERWVDVSNKSFQSFIINELEPLLRSKGADGYFIDNCDVYANYKKDKIYNGLKTILSSIHSKGLPMLINGGDIFVSKTINDGSYSSLFDGVNQEEVFTVINFDNHTYHNQSGSEKKYYQEYLSKVKSKNLKVYLLEYGANKQLEQEISNYCKRNGFAYYNSKSYNLN